MATAVVMPLTVTGVGLTVVGLPGTGPLVPLPSWPKSFSPQHCTVPLARSAQVWKPPAVTAMAVVIPVTRTGATELNVVVAGSPRWPESLRPQHCTVPFPRGGQEGKPPALTAAAPPDPAAATGAGGWGGDPSP